MSLLSNAVLLNCWLAFPHYGLVLHPAPSLCKLSIVQSWRNSIYPIAQKGQGRGTIYNYGHCALIFIDCKYYVPCYVLLVYMAAWILRISIHIKLSYNQYV